MLLSFLNRFVQETVFLFNEMAIYLLLGFFLAGLIHAFLPEDRIKAAIGRPGLLASFKAALFGVPLPLCSCGVVPTALAIRNSGGSRGATVSFLISTPQTGVDSIAATASMLGPVFAVFRALVAFVTGCLGGFITDLTDPERRKTGAAFAAQAVPRAEAARHGNRWREAFRYGFDTLLLDIARWVVLGLVIGGAIAAVVPPGFFERTFQSPLLAYGTMLLVSVPIYVCATGSIPVAMAMVMKGLSPGAAFVFLMAGPATNAASLTILWKTLGRRTTVLFLVVIMAGAVGGGLLFDGLFADAFHRSFTAMHHGAAPWTIWMKRAGSAVLAALLIRVLLPRRDRTKPSEKENGMTDQQVHTLTVTGMTCSHCKMNVERAARSVPGVTNAVADPAGDSLQVSGSCDLDAVRKAVEAAGYGVGSAD